MSPFWSGALLRRLYFLFMSSTLPCARRTSRLSCQPPAAPGNGAGLDRGSEPNRWRRGRCRSPAQLLAADGFAVERPSGGYPAAPAVGVSRGNSGPAFQFNGHLDTVHLPFAPPRVENSLLTGSGASDMKGGIAAAVEALRALRDAGCLERGVGPADGSRPARSPLGRRPPARPAHSRRDSRRRRALARAALQCAAGRGKRLGDVEGFHSQARGAVHEVMRPRDEPSVIAAAAELILRLGRLDSELAARSHPVCGAASVFIGQIHSGEIFNQYPHEAWLEGTRRWLPGDDHHAVQADFRSRLAQLAAETQTMISCDWMMIRDAFSLDQTVALVTAFQKCYRESTGRVPLPEGAKPFVDDGNSFWALAGIPAITHGPKAGGQHTVSEWVEIDDLVRVAKLYASTAVVYCHAEAGGFTGAARSGPLPPRGGGLGWGAALANVTVCEAGATEGAVMHHELARELRKNMTDAERRVWSRLRGRQLGGYKFRRQAPIGPYIVDFVCFEAKLIIELDGGQHVVRST